MYADDATRLHYMRDAAREALSFVQNRTRRDLDTDRMLAYALVGTLEMIGEAAANITETGRAQLPEVPWDHLTIVRNQFREDYAQVDLDSVWSIVTEDLPELIPALEKLIASRERVSVSPARRWVGASSNITIPHDQIKAFCRHHHIRKLSLFGSVLRDDFRPNSDIDVLVEFEPGQVVGLLTLAEMEMELSELLERKVDLRTPEDLSRYFRQKVLDTAEVQYVHR